MPSSPACRDRPSARPRRDERSAPREILLTGATGLVGGAVLAELVARGSTNVVCLVRSPDRASALERLKGSLATWLDGRTLTHAMRRIGVVLGDVAREDLGLDRRTYAELAQRTGAIVHCAASVRFDEPLAAIRAINVSGLRRILEIGADATASGGLRRIVIVSTAFVSGTTPRPFSEHELDRGQSFRTTYEQSKFEAEQLARAAMADLPIAVVRPSIVVGHSRSGRTSTFNVLFAPLRLALRRGTDVTLPVRADLPLDVVPVDWVARLIVEAMTRGEAGQTYAAASGSAALTMRDLAEMTGAVFGVPAPRLLPAAASDHVVDSLLAGWERRLSSRGRAILGVYEPYLRSAAQFDSWRGDHLMWRAGVRGFDPATVLRRSLEYARATDFGRLLRSDGRTLARTPSAA